MVPPYCRMGTATNFKKFHLISSEQLALNGDTEFFNIVAEVLQGDKSAPYLLIICLHYVLRMSIDPIKEICIILKKTRSR